MGDATVQEKASSFSPDKSSESAKQSLLAESRNENPRDLQPPTTSKDSYLLPQIDLFQKAEQSSKSNKVLNPNSAEFKQTCLMYEGAIKNCNYLPSLDEAKSLNPAQAKDIYKAIGPDAHAPANMRLKYAEFLSQVGEKSNTPSLRAKALSQLNDIEKVDPKMFIINPQVVGEIKQLQSGGWINKEQAPCLALTSIALKSLGAKASYSEYALNGFSGPSDKSKATGITALAVSLTMNPTHTKEIFDKAKKECASSWGKSLDEAYRLAEIEAAKMVLAEKAKK
ncbi:MAG: hypothetical protein K2X81_20650 [Candidatus Obscuribacterales bacterium]|nr:hypothetical protein [Candidatus Obscuribacterales bacterium]